MEDKLNEYRVRKRRQEVISSIKDRFFKMISPKPTTKTDVAINLQVEDDKVVLKFSVS